MKNYILSVIMAVAVVILASCSKNDPTPTQAQKTALDSVKAAMTGVWKFTSVTVAQISPSKSATTSNCGRAELYTAGFANTNWLLLTPEFNYTYNSDGTASESNNCFTATAKIKVTPTLNSDKSVNLTISDAISSNVLTVYQVKSKNITSTTILANIVSDGVVTSAGSGYTLLFKFTRQ